MEKFHEKLKRLRIEKGLTQKEVAKQLKISETGYAGYEQGYREPDFTMLTKICSYFDVTSDYLLGLENEDGSRSESSYEFEYDHDNTHLKHKETKK